MARVDGDEEAALDLDGAVVVVTGANGFVGGRVSRALAWRGATVRALVRRPGEAEVLDADGIEEVTGSFTDPDDVARVLDGAAAVVHCAATSGDDLEPVRAVNRDGTRTVVRGALAEGSRVVHISTGSVYARGDRDVVDEDTPRTSEGDPYAVTKAEAEVEVESATADGLAATILRPPAVLGWGPTSTWGQRIPALVRDGALPVRRRPENTFAWVHVDDLADAVVAALEDDAPRGAAYNVVGGHTTWGRYLDDVRRWFPAAPDPLGDADGPVWTGRFPADRIRADLGVEATRSYDEAMAEAAARWT